MAARLEGDRYAPPAEVSPNRTNPTAVAAIWVSIGVVAVIGLLFAIHAVRQQVYRDRRIAIDMRETKEHAEVTGNEVEKCAAAIIALTEPAMAQAEEVNRIMVSMIGAPPEKTGSKTSSSRVTSSAKRSDSTSPAAPSGADDDEEVPEGLMSRAARVAQIEAERRRQEARKQDTTVDSLGRSGENGTSTPSGADAGSAYARRTTSREEPRIQALGRKTKNLSESIERKGLTAREMESSALRFKSLALTQKLYAKVKLRAKELDGLLADIQKLEQDTQNEMQQIETYVSEAKGLEDTHKQELARIEAEKEAERQAKEHAALVKKEIARAGDTRRFNRELIEKNDFTEALRSVSDAMSRFKTDDGRAKLALLEDKYQRLAGLKAFLVERLSKKPMSFGWIQDGPKVDILGADDSGVKIRDKLTPWSSVTLPQMIKLIDFYLESEEIPISRRGEHGFAAAIYFHELGKPEVADVYLERATTLLPALQAEATRLLEE